MMKRFAALLTLALTAGLVQAEEKDTRTPLERYQGDAQFALLSCPISFKIAQLKAQAGEEPGDKGDWRGCIAQHQKTGRTNLDAALRTLKKAAAREALKSYHVAFVAALEGIRPGLDETKLGYNMRQQALNDKLTAAWARFEVEQ